MSIQRLEVKIHSKITGEQIGLVAIAISSVLSEEGKIKHIKKVLGWAHKHCAVYKDSGVTELHPKGEEEAAVF